MKKLILIFFVCVFPVIIKAQTSKNSVVFELGGNGFGYSINYERYFVSNVNGRVGFSFFYVRENQTEKTLSVMSYPISTNYLFDIGGEKHFIETGIGVMNLLTSGDLVEYKGVTNFYINPFLNLGYRYRSQEKKITFKAGITPFYGTKSLTNPTEQGFSPFGSRFQIWGVVGIGFNF